MEVTNRSIVEGIRARLGKAKGKWADKLELVLWAYRTSPKTATGEAPFNLVNKSSVVIPAEVGMTTHRILNYNEEKNGELIRENLDMLDEERKIAHIRSEKYKSQVRAMYNRKVKIKRFSVGDLVLRRVDTLKPTGKLDANWEGPYIVTEVLKGGAYKLTDQEGKKLPCPWNIRNLKKYYV